MARMATASIPTSALCVAPFSAASCGLSPMPGARSVHYAAERWAHLVWTACDVPHDPRTLGDWARAVGVSVPTLRARCYVAGVSPRSSLALTRLLRAIRCASAEGSHPADILDVKEPRTVRKLLRSGGLLPARATVTAPPSLAAFLDGQALITARYPLDSLRRLAAADIPPR